MAQLNQFEVTFFTQSKSRTKNTPSLQYSNLALTANAPIHVTIMRTAEEENAIIDIHTYAKHNTLRKLQFSNEFQNVLNQTSKASKGIVSSNKNHRVICGKFLFLRRVTALNLN